MSKITPKNLSYDSTLPPFLARLQANQSSSDGRHEFAIARPKKARNAEEDAEDEPVYFNEESGETLTKTEWEKRDAEESKFGDAKPAEVPVETPIGENGEGNKTVKEKEKVAAIGVGKKRKVGKIVGAEEDGDDDIKAAVSAVAALSKKTDNAKSESKKGDKSKGAKKGKKIKLSFDD